MFEKAKKPIKGLIITLASTVIGGLILGVVANKLTENPRLWIPIIVFTIIIAIIGIHIIISNDKEQTNEENFPLWSFLTGLISFLLLIALIVVLIIPSSNEKIIAYLIPASSPESNVDQPTNDPTRTLSPFPTSEMADSNSTEKIIENTESIVLTTENNSYRFDEDCIPDNWKAFNINAISNEGCIEFPFVNMEGLVDGFSVTYDAEQPISFIIYDQLGNNISTISFKFQINTLKSNKFNASSDFYFGFLPHDINNFYSFQGSSSDHIEFDGEFAIISGLDPTLTYGVIHQNDNTYNYFNRGEFDIEFQESYVFQTNIDIYGNMWNVNIRNLSKQSNNFDRTGLNTKGNYFAFGFRIPSDGAINLRVFDWAIN